MPKTVSSPFLDHQQGEVTTVCTCWELTRKPDGVSFYFTDHDQDIVFDSGSGTHTYISAVGYVRSAVSSNSDLSADNVELRGIFDDSSITNDDLQSGLFDFADVHMFMVNWADLTMGKMVIHRGNLGDVQGTTAGVFTTQLNGLGTVLNHNVGELYQPSCRADLFSTGLGQCNKDSTGFIKTATVTGVTDQRTFAVAVTEPRAVDTWFARGVVVWTSGNNNGRASEIKAWAQSSSLVTMYLPWPKPIQVGDTLTIQPGCDKSLHGLNGCKVKFDNVVNRQAEDYVPGTAFVVQGPATQQ